MSFRGSLKNLKGRVSLWPASGEFQVKGHPQASHDLVAHPGRAIAGQVS
jgi:hypothetical protein